MTTFAELGLSESTLETLKHLGYATPTPIQEQAIPSMMQGKDVIGQAQTGTGKTAAFGLPMVEYADPDDPSVQALVLTPTRELCIQVTQALRAYGEQKGLNVVAVFGGAPIRDQAARLKDAQIVVGTVGRVMDMIGRHHLFLDNARYVVLDEADEMLDLGFLEDVESILKRAPMGRQTALFSATVPPEIRRLADTFMHDPVEIKVRAATLTIDTVDHFYVEVPDKEKPDALVRVLKEERPEQAIVFVRTKIGVDRLARRLGDAGRAREGAARRHVPGPARRRDDRLQGWPRAPADRNRRGRPRARHHRREPRRELRHPELAGHLRAPHRPDRPRRRERARDHADHAEAAARAGGDRAPREDGDRGVERERQGPEALEGRAGGRPRSRPRDAQARGTRSRTRATACPTRS